MLRVQTNFTNIGVSKNNTQNKQASYKTKIGFNNKCDEVSFGRSNFIPDHQEVLTQTVKLLLKKVVKKAEVNQSKFHVELKNRLEKTLSKFKATKSKKLQGEIFLNQNPDVGAKFRLIGNMPNGEQVRFHLSNDDFSDYVISFGDEKSVSQPLWIKNDNILDYVERKGYKSGDLNKKLEEGLMAILANKPVKKKASSK